jgi:hypothetical protein
MAAPNCGNARSVANTDFVTVDLQSGTITPVTETDIIRRSPSAASFSFIDPNPQMAGEITRWTKGYWEAVHPYSASGGYVNFMMDDGDDSRLKATYAGNYDRLVALTSKYDPTNFFRVNQNIRPLHA